MQALKKNASGILLCLVIAVPAWFLGKSFPIIGGPVFGILIGIIAAALKRPPVLEPGIKYTSKKILQYSIILLGFGMNFFNIIKVGKDSLYVMLFTISASLLIAYFLGKALKLHPNATTLIGVGTSICGGSAIAATAPVINASDEEVAQAISTIFLFNVIAVLIFPALGRMMGLSDTGFGMWAGTAVNDTSSVVAASAAWSEVAGNDTALSFATIVKLTRTLMIVPITLVLALYTAKKAKQNNENSFSFRKVFPWFVLWFLVAAVINTLFTLPAGLPQALTDLGKFMIVMALSAIGLNTNLRKLLTNGAKSIFLGFCCWFGVAAVSLLVQSIGNIL